jgi:hypothetical protein
VTLTLSNISEPISAPGSGKSRSYTEQSASLSYEAEDGCIGVLSILSELISAPGSGKVRSYTEQSASLRLRTGTYTHSHIVNYFQTFSAPRSGITVLHPNTAPRSGPTKPCTRRRWRGPDLGSIYTQTAPALRQPDNCAGHQILTEATFLVSSSVGRTQFAGGCPVLSLVSLSTPASGASEG